ncbi:MAG: zinc metalloprotease HtpX [Chloroflexi bacterium]|nr:zinc metalloprotease HtpX [Chloroflexota bacterium]
MTRREIRADTELTLRMFFTWFLLAGVYAAFVALLFWAGVNFIGIAIVAALLLGVQFFFSDRLVVWSTRAKEVSAQEEPHLHATVERLAAAANLPKPKVYVMNADIPNAFATGRNPKNSLIAVTRGLMRRLDQPELEAVLAHELTHVKNRDVLVLTLASFFATIAAFLMRMFFWSSLFGGFGGGSGDRRGGGQAAAMFMVVWIGTIVIYFLAQLLIMALSRYREYAADRGGAILTGAPSQLASALMKISGSIARIPDKDLREVASANAFFIIPAIKGGDIVNLFATHPPVEKRIERLRLMQRQLEGL